jgi:protein-S-isoprenylcysteine O-methyltransferase Ste14
MTEVVDDLARRAFKSTAGFLLAMAVMLFLPAFTLRYWQGWLFLLVFAVMCASGTLYFLKRDPELVARRMAVGPAAETEPTQKRIMTFASACVMAIIIVPALDHHFGWSSVPASIVILADAALVLSFLAIFRVFAENSFAAATVRTAPEQRVIDTGPYALVRHPMYSAAVPMFGATPIALGSWWGLVLMIPLVAMLAWRLSDEEQFLLRDLPGYAAYREHVRYRLLPGIW